MLAPSARLAVTALLCVGLRAQDKLRVDVNLVLVPVTVTDRHGKLVTGLDESRFRILEDGVRQPIASFSTEELPVSIGLVLDVSGSMKPKLTAAREFVRALLSATATSDEALFLTCADQPEVQADLAAATRADGWTALIDSIYMTVDRLRQARNPRKVLIVVSDGQDNHSRYGKSELRSKLLESDAQVYTIAMRDPAGARKAIEMSEENRGLLFLSDLAQSSGGLYFAIDSPDAIVRVAGQIGRTLHDQYVLGYYPPSNARNGRRRIQVQVDPPEFRPYSRSSYFAATP
jgi:Ca-activated chloride channel family protein